MISLPQALARAVGTTNVYPAGHAVADWLDGRNPYTTATAAHYATMIRKALRQSNQPGPDDRPDASLRAELLAELASQREVVSSLRERVERLERRWTKERSVKDSLTVGGNGPAVPDGREPASVVGEPSDEELLGLDQLEDAWNAQADAANGWNELGLDEIIVWAQRQALARWGHQPTPPGNKNTPASPESTEMNRD